MEHQEPQLNHYLKQLWQGKWIILLTTVVALAGIVAFTWNESPPTPLFQASATVVAEPVSAPVGLGSLPQSLNSLSSGLTSGNASINTQVKLITSRNVMERALKKLQPESESMTPGAMALQVEALQQSIAVLPVPNTNFIEIRARATSAEMAEKRANAVVQAYIDYVKDDRTKAIQDALDEVKRQIQAPTQPEDVGARALDVLPGVGQELASIADSVEQSAQKLGNLQTQEQDTNSTQSLLSLESKEVQRTARELDSIVQDLAGIRQDMGKIQQSGSNAQSTLGAELPYIERANQDLGSISRDLQDISGNVQGRDASKVYSDMAAQAGNARATLDEVPVVLGQVRANSAQTSTALLSITDYIKSISDDLKKIVDQLQAASTNKGLTDQERIKLEGQVSAFTVGLTTASNDLRQLRTSNSPNYNNNNNNNNSTNTNNNYLGAQDYGHIVTAEGLIGTSSKQLTTLSTQLSSASNSSRLNDGVSQILDWVSEGQQTLEAVTKNLRDTGQAADSGQQVAALSFQAGGEIDNVVSLLNTASVRLQGLQSITTDPLVSAQLSAVGSRLTATRNSLSGSSSRLTPISQANAVTLADRLGVVQDRVQKGADGLRDTLDHIEVATHLPSSVMNNEPASQAYSTAESISRSLEIASRQLQGLLTTNTDPLIDGELSTLGDQLITAQGDVQAISQRLSTVVVDPGSSSPSGLATNQLRLETATRILRTASNLPADMTTSADGINQDSIAKTREQIEIAVAIVNLSVGDITNLEASETDALRYGQLVVLEQRLKDAATQTTDIITQLKQLQGGRGPQYLQLRQLEQQLGLALLQPQDTGITVVDSAVLPQATGSTSFVSRLRIPLVALAGLMLGSVGVLVKSQLDRTVRSTIQIREQLGLANLGVVPKGNVSKRQLPKLNAPGLSSFSEALQLVGTSLSGPMSQGHRAFLVTSSGAQEGKTTLAVNLAQVLLQYGRRVLLVDGNLRKPEVARLLGLTGKAGLAEALASQRNPMDYVVDSDGISVLPGGTPPSNPVELLSSPAMSLFLQQAQQRYDVVIIDSPPAVGFAETKAMGKSSGGAILVIKGGSTSIESVREARDEMASAGVPLVGVVLNFAPSEECGHLRHDKYGADI